MGADLKPWSLHLSTKPNQWPGPNIDRPVPRQPPPVADTGSLPRNLGRQSGPSFDHSGWRYADVSLRQPKTSPYVSQHGCDAGLSSFRKAPPVALAPAQRVGANSAKVLVLGVCLCDRPNNVETVISVLAGTANYGITQRWEALGEGQIGPMLSKVVRYPKSREVPKYELLNGLLAGEDLAKFEYVVIVDDDIALPDRFLDHFLSLQAKLDLQLAQPARTPNSYIDHPIVRRVDGVLGRQTLFVESGPVVSIHRSAFRLLFPFDLTSPMGWGYENVWAYRLSRNGLRMGIIDACPVDHSLRAPASCYDRAEAEKAQRRLLNSQGHLPLEECCRTLNIIEDSAGRTSSAPSVRLAPVGQITGVNVSGYFASEKGVGEAVRADIRALAAAGIPYVLNNVTDPRSLNQETDLTGFSAENPHPINLIHVSADTIPEFVRRMGAEYFADRYNIGFWAWELSQFPRHWRPRFNYFDEIWVPSRFAQASVSRDAPVPVWTVPHCVGQVPVAPQKTRADFGLPAGSFLFLFAFDFDSRIERKNPMGLIVAFKKAFTPDDEAILVLKCSHAEASGLALDTLQDAARGARVQIINRVLSRGDMNDLMGLADCYISLHRCEGFGLTMAEAMALGKPVVATQYSGNLDFMTPENSFLVPYELVEIQKDIGYYSKGCIWADPELDRAARLMRYVFENRDVAAAVGRRAREDVLSKLHPRVVGGIIKDRLLQIVAHSAPRGERVVMPPPPPPNAPARIRHSVMRAGSPPRLVGVLTGPRTPSLECSIVTPVYNNSALTRRYLNALLSSRPESVSFDVIVVDDGSTDSTREALRAYGKAIRLVARETNSGFATACNEGAAIASAEFLVFLNNDTVPQPGWLDALVRHARRHPKAGIVGSKLLFPDGTIQHAGVVIGQNRYPRHIYIGFPGDYPAANVSRRFRAVTGACMLVRRYLFDQIGGFDTAFTNGFEDVDLCFRAGELGFEVHYCHHSVLIHLQSATRAGRADEESRNCEVYQSRWGRRVEPDDFRYYREDPRPSAFGYRPHPLAAVLSPRPAPPPPNDLGESVRRAPTHLSTAASEAQAAALIESQAPCATDGLLERGRASELVRPRRAPSLA
jgi:GT2 family glycosyltransferase/glycosyltransferase involved in cell wall biosynthesis